MFPYHILDQMPTHASGQSPMSELEGVLGRSYILFSKETKAQIKGISSSSVQLLPHAKGRLTLTHPLVSGPLPVGARMWSFLCGIFIKYLPPQSYR